MSLKPKSINFDDKWKELSKLLEILINNSENLPKSNWQDGFMLVYTLCTANSSENLFMKTYFATKTLLENHVDSIKDDLQVEDKLVVYQEKWDKYHRGSQYINSFFSYMNKQHITSNNKNPHETRYGIDYSNRDKISKEVGEMALDVWKQRLLEPLSQDLVTLVLDAITEERLGTLQRSSVIHDVIQSFVQVDTHVQGKYDLPTYKNIFEKRYLDETEKFYNKEAQKLLGDHSCSEYMVCVLERLNNEKYRCQKYLHKTSWDLVWERCSTQMVKSHLQYLQSQTADIFKCERWTDLRNMYLLFKADVNAIEPLNDSFYNFVKEKGLEALRTLFESANEQNDTVLAKNFVEAVLQVHGHFSDLIKEYLDSDQLFLSSLDKAFMVIVNFKEDKCKTSKSSELLAKYCDFLLKKNKVSEIEIDEKLGMAVTVLKYIEEPDMFQKFYQRNLARRLIQNQSISMDSEESMIKQLKVACNFEFINKLNRMFTDITISGQLIKNFSEYLNEHNHSSSLGFSSFNIHVLSAGFWPLNHTPAVTVRIPEDIQKFVVHFKEFYDVKFTGRRLYWLHHLCSGDVTIRCSKKNYIVNMSTYQYAVLSLFNKQSAITVKDISDSTDISLDNLQKVLQSMSGQMPLLLISSPSASSESESASKEIHEDSLVRVNEDFYNKLTKFKITFALQRETEKEIQHTRSSVEEDRRMFLQAAIVRTMKARKSMRHNDLVQEVIKQSMGRFPANSAGIKRAIEGLIEKAYLERSANSAEVYEYVA